MKILMIIQHGKIGGIEQHVLTLSKTLKEKKYEVEVLMLFNGGPMVDLFEKNGVSVDILYGKNGHDFRLFFKFINKINTIKPDILHFHVGTLITSVALNFTKQIPIIVTEHMAKEGRPIFLSTKLIYSILFNKAKKILCVSDSTKNSLLNYNNKLSTKTVTVYNGIELTKVITSDMFPEFEYTIGAVGRLDEGKGWEKFIEISEKIIKKFTYVHFVIIGDGPHRKKLEEYATVKKLDNNIHFLGFRNDVRDLVKSLDLYIMLSEFEACPLSLLEVMSVKTPVTGFLPKGGVKEIIKDIYYLIEEREDSLLVEEIEKFILKKYDLKNMVDKAYKRINEKFEASIMTDKVIEIYKESVK